MVIILDHEQLDTFLSLTKTKNFTRTAEELNVVQSTVTTRIKALEEEIGESLFSRKARRVEMTQEGRTFYEYAMNIIQLMNESGEAVRLQKKYKERIVFAAVGSVWESQLFKMIKTVKNKNMAIRMITDHSLSIIKQISYGSVDIGFVYTVPVSPDFEAAELYEEELLLVSGKKIRKIHSKELLDYSYIHYNWGKAFMEWFEQEIENEGMMPWRVDSISLAMNLLNEGGIAFLPKSIASPYIKQGQLFAVQFTSHREVPERKVYIVYKKNNWKKINNTVTYIKENIYNYF